MAENNDLGRGLRKDGKSYKENNTRPDGSYVVGKNRPDPKHQFQKEDGRPRGKRGKGRRNLLTEWREELDSKVQVTEAGKKKKLTKRRTVIKSQIDRAMKRSDRAAETVLRYAELSEKRDPGLQADDYEIIDLWLTAQHIGNSYDAGQLDVPLDQSEGGVGDGVVGDA